MNIKSPKKLIEVALPLDAINVAAAREKSIRHGHPSTLHLWWARRPLAAARAVLFAQLVNDPGYERHLQRGVNKELAKIKRDQLFKIIEKLVLWENTNNEEVLEEARQEIRISWRETCKLNKDHPEAAELFNPEKLPAFHDPFAGGGSIPLEAQRLGLEAYASDLNPVAVLINKAMIEIPPKFAGRPPVNPELRKKKDLIEREWKGAQGLAEDVRYYGQWMRDEAEKRIGHLYPKVEVTKEMAEERPDLKPLLGQELTVVAWLWARTVKSPNPAFSEQKVPLASTFVLFSKVGKQAYIEPILEGSGYRFTVKTGPPAESVASGTTAGKRNAFLCLLSGSPIDYNYIRAEGKAKRLGQRLMAVVAESTQGRVYLSPTPEQEELNSRCHPDWTPDMDLPNNPRDFKTPNYGMTKFGDLFTPRQLVALTTFSDLVQQTIHKVQEDALRTGMPDDGGGLDSGGDGATAYAQSVGVYLACTLGRAADYWSSNATWEPGGGFLAHVFTKQAIPMVWDFAEGNPFSNGTGNWGKTALDWVVRVIRELTPIVGGICTQQDAASQRVTSGKIVSTDPPYYDNIGYADLSDYFYVWMRRTLKPVFPLLFATLGVPKSEELVATPYRHGGKERAEAFFLDGMTCAIRHLVY